MSLSMCFICTYYFNSYNNFRGRCYYPLQTDKETEAQKVK